MENIRQGNLDILHSHRFGIEELSNGDIDLYNDNTYLYIGKFANHKKLAEWIEENIK